MMFDSLSENVGHKSDRDLSGAIDDNFKSKTIFTQFETNSNS